MFDGFVMGLFPLVARPALLDLLGEGATATIGTWMSAIYAVFLVGAALGGILFGWLGDRIGRVRAMVWSIVAYSVFTGLCGLVQTPWQLCALRFLAALGMGGEWSLGVALVMEIWPAKRRPLAAGLIGAAANVGFTLIGVAGLMLSRLIGEMGDLLRASPLPPAWTDALLANSAWRLIWLIGALPVFLAIWIRIFVPESQRWKEAARHAAHKNRVSDVFRNGLARPTLLAMAIGAVALLGTWGSVQWIPPWADRLSNKLPEARSWSMIWMSVGAIVGTMLAAGLAQWFSRRRAYFLLCLSSLLACAYLFRVPMEYGSTFLVWVFIVGGLSASFYGWMPLYLPELFPTRIRATGQGMAYNFGRVFAAAGALGGGQLLNAFGEDYARMCAVISLIYAVGLVIIWFCPETKGRPLPE